MSILKLIAHTVTLIVILCAHFPNSIIHAQGLLKQLNDDQQPQAMTSAELNDLGDPLFLLVLRNNSQTTSLKEIENLIQPLPTNRRVFVVDEAIANPARNQNQSRRAVITFGGSNGGQVLNNTLMLSIFFNELSFPDTPARIEAWGFDTSRGRINYYLMSRDGNSLRWKFRGSSNGADQLTGGQRRGTCFACHVNGGPVMKELARPWNNWHSIDSQATYLLPTAPAAVRWPVADQTPRFKGRLDQAENLETKIISVIREFNTSRVMDSIQRNPDGTLATDAQGMSTVTQGRRLLRSLFETTEVNLISSLQKSRLHPLPDVNLAGPAQAVTIPNTFFLNSNLLGPGGGVPGLTGLGIAPATQFSAIAKIEPAEYKQLIVSTSTKLFGKNGDTDFAWFTPEASQIDNDMVDRLMRLGVVSPEFVAAVLAIDLEMPVFSLERARLLRFVPDQFKFKRRVDPNAPFDAPRDELIDKMIASLQSASGDASAQRLLQLLRGINLQAPQDPNNPRKILQTLVSAYQTRISSKLQNPQTRKAELDRLYRQLLDRRRAFLADPIISTLNETDNGLLALP